jgi:hypothetical protein
MGFPQEDSGYKESIIHGNWASAPQNAVEETQGRAGPTIRNERPSIIVIFFPATLETHVTQERAAKPSM